MLFSRGYKSKLGIDIGTSSIKVVQLVKEQDKFTLQTYGTVNVAFPGGLTEGFDAISRTAEILKSLTARAKTTTKKVVASLPNSIVFVSVIDMPEMSEKELKDSIEFEARRYVPLPLEEVTLSWSVLKEGQLASPKVKVLLTAVPTNVIDNYLKMFRLAGLEPIALEIESLALIRSLVGTRRESFIIIDMGARSTSLNLVDKGFLRVSRNLSVGGETITNAVAQGLKVSFARAEQFKRDLGLSEGASEQIPQTMRQTLDTIKGETSQLLNIYQSSGGTIAEIIFAGSASRLPGLVKYFSDLGPKVALGDPLQFISYDSRLRSNLSENALALSVSLGLAMRE